MKYRGKDINNIKPEDRRWSWMEVDLCALRYNINQIKNFISPKCKLCAVVKADAYGHGAVQIAKVAVNCGASYLAVAAIDEAIELREAGIDQPILILSQPPETSIELLVEYDLMPTLYSPDFAIMYAEAADKAGQTAPFHLAINTGMNRVGVKYSQVLDFFKLISFHRALDLKGVFTHFATADCPENMDFYRQLENFRYAVSQLENDGIDPGIVHCANSASIFRYPETHFDMVRMGICMYGYHPCNETKTLVDLKPIMSIKAKITDERILATGEGVSYAMNYRAPGVVKICTIPIGYADGLNRSLSSKIDVIYKGVRFPQVGNICMDMCMFEIPMHTDYAQENFNAQIGDEVILVGRAGQSIITLEDLANISGTISYEIACALSRRLPTIYITE